jgi:hypothetical protein
MGRSMTRSTTRWRKKNPSPEYSYVVPGSVTGSSGPDPRRQLGRPLVWVSTCRAVTRRIRGVSASGAGR